MNLTRKQQKIAIAYGDAGVSQVCEVGTVSGRSLRP